MMAEDDTIENFDRERGTVLVLPDSLAKMLVLMGPDVAKGVLWEFLLWFTGDGEGCLADPRDDGLLKILKENQRRSAEAVFRRRTSQRENSKQRWKKGSDAVECQGMPRDAAGDKEKERKPKEEKQKASLPSSEDRSPSVCAAGGVAPGDSTPFPSPRYLKVRAAAEKGPGGADWTMEDLDRLSRDPVTTILRFLREEKSPYSRNALAKFLKNLGRGTVVDTFLEMMDEDDPPVKERGKLLFGRLKGISMARGGGK